MDFGYGFSQAVSAFVAREQAELRREVLQRHARRAEMERAAEKRAGELGDVRRLSATSVQLCNFFMPVFGPTLPLLLLCAAMPTEDPRWEAWVLAGAALPLGCCLVSHLSHHAFSKDSDVSLRDYLILFSPFCFTAALALGAALVSDPGWRAGLLGICTLVPFSLLTYFVLGFVHQATGSQGGHSFGDDAKWLRLLALTFWLVAVAALAVLTVRHGLQGFWWTALVVWPPVACFTGGRLFRIRSDARASQHHLKSSLEAERERERAQREVRERTIVFHGAVLDRPGKACIASWPGKYATAWDTLVRSARDGEVSATVVFLPEGTAAYGLHVYFKDLAGKGHVESFLTAGTEHLRRERIYSRKRQYEASAEFQFWLEAGLKDLSKEPGEDGTSPSLPALSAS